MSSCMPGGWWWSNCTFCSVSSQECVNMWILEITARGRKEQTCLRAFEFCFFVFLKKNYSVFASKLCFCVFSFILVFNFSYINKMDGSACTAICQSNTRRWKRPLGGLQIKMLDSCLHQDSVNTRTADSLHRSHWWWEVLINNSWLIRASFPHSPF